MAPCKTTAKKPNLSRPRKPSKPAKLTRQTKPLIERKSSTPLKGRNAIFTGKIFVLSGEFSNPHNTIEGWITHHGGRIDKAVTDETTHLVCTVDNFRNKASDASVTRALRLGKSRCKIVDWEFVEDSVLPKPRHISEETYQLEKILARKKRKIATVRHQKKNSRKDPEGPKEVMELPRHHIHVDETGLKYEVILQRTTSLSDRRKQEETLTIYLFESDPIPHTYRLAQKHERLGVPAVLLHDEDVGRAFQKAYAEFKSIFEENTGIDWDRRGDDLKVEKGKVESTYIYLPQGGGKPAGLLQSRPSGQKKPQKTLSRNRIALPPLQTGRRTILTVEMNNSFSSSEGAVDYRPGSDR